MFECWGRVSEKRGALRVAGEQQVARWDCLGGIPVRSSARTAEGVAVRATTVREQLFGTAPKKSHLATDVASLNLVIFHIGVPAALFHRRLRALTVVVSWYAGGYKVR